VQTLARIPFITEERARTLIEAARQSVASADDEVTCEVVQETARQILHLDQVIERQKKRLCTQPGLPKEVALLTTFKGLGTYTAIGLLIHIQNVDRFASAKKLSSFFGLHPSFRQSGDGHTGSRMSKKGAPSVRAMLFMVTFSAIQSNPVIAPLYQRRIEQGMSRMAAIGVCMHKTLRILYGMLKTGTAFDPMVEQHHRERTAIKPRTPGQSDKRRYLVYDRSAPVSRRADRRRRQQKSSQGAGGTTNGMSSSTAARSSVTTGAKTATPKTIQKR
jgi:transposase